MLNKDNLNSLTSCLPSSLLRSICLLAMLQWLDTTISDIYFQFSPNVKCAVMAEWLRRLTRNQMGSSRVGSNPADCENFLSQVIQKANVEQKDNLNSLTSCLPACFLRSICFLAILQWLDYRLGYLFSIQSLS